MQIFIQLCVLLPMGRVAICGRCKCMNDTANSLMSIYIFSHFLSTQVGQEYDIQRIAKRDSCIPVAEVLHLSTAAEEEVVGAKFMVMKFVEVNKVIKVPLLK